MREIPILMSGDLVRATLDRHKTETRRPVKPQPYDGTEGYGRRGSMWQPYEHHGGVACPCDEPVRCPYGDPGDLLYVRERTMVWHLLPPDEQGQIRMRVEYVADGLVRVVPWPTRIKPVPNGHCLPNGAFNEAARLWLRVESVSVERVEDITEDGARAEGCETRDAFLAAFAAIYPTLGNGWIWVVRYSVASTTGPRPRSSHQREAGPPVSRVTSPTESETP